LLRRTRREKGVVMVMVGNNKTRMERKWTAVPVVLRPWLNERRRLTRRLSGRRPKTED
jgi:hypothetical protein